jgi:hypothetical protein
MCINLANKCACADPCNAYPISSDTVGYVGPNLPGTGINTCDSLTLVIQKLDNEILELRQALFGTTTTTTTTVI